MVSMYTWVLARLMETIREVLFVNSLHVGVKKLFGGWNVVVSVNTLIPAPFKACPQM